MQFGDHLSPETVAIGWAAASKDKLLRQLADFAAERTGVEAAAIARALAAREQLGSTGIGNGIAIPHALVEGLEACFTLVVRLAKPIDFEAVDEVPVDLVILLLSPASAQGQNLNLLSSIAREFRDDDVVEAIRAARSADEIFVLLTRK